MSTNGSAGGDAVLPAESPELAPGETCPNESGVNGPVRRSCRSCLRKTDCGVSVNGMCYDKNEPAIAMYKIPFPYDSKLLNGTTTEASRCTRFTQSFLASDFDYCAVDDTTCSACVRNYFGVGEPKGDSRYCVGKDGCVCIFVCEFPDTSTPRIGCSPSIDVEQRVRDFMNFTGYVMALLLLVGVIFSVRSWRQQRDSRLAAEERQRLRREARGRREAEREQQREQFLADIGVGLLGLGGWNKYREGLIENEQMQLSLTTTAAPNIEVKEESVDEEERQDDQPYVEVKDDSLNEDGNRDRRSTAGEGA